VKEFIGKWRKQYKERQKKSMNRSRSCMHTFSCTEEKDMMMGWGKSEKKI